MTPKSTTDTDRALGQRIRALRKAKSLSQTALGKVLGVTFQQIQKYEKGTNRVSSGRLQQVAQTLEVPLSALFGEDQPDTHTKLFGFLAETGAVDLLRAYVSIQNEELRRDVLAIVRTAARISLGLVEGNG